MMQWFEAVGNEDLFKKRSGPIDRHAVVIEKKSE